MKKKSKNTSEISPQQIEPQSDVFTPLAQLLLDAYDRIEEKMRLLDERKEKSND